MTKSGEAPYTPIAIPAGLVPRWEQRYPGRLRFELDALQSAGIAPEVDGDALKAGQLALTFDWPLDGATTLQLKAVYPDAFPHIRPQVFLISGLDPPPVRHRSPMEGNLCLLGRDARQWMPSWTLYRLLAEQLEAALRGTGDEDPQGEPAEYWWNGLNPSGSFCLVDSAWNLGDAQEGTLLLRYASAGTKNEARGEQIKTIPIIRAYVAEVRAGDNSVLHQWNGPLPPDLASAKSSLDIPWVCLAEELMPEPPIDRQIDRLRQDHDRLRTSKQHRLPSGIVINLSAVVHPSELGFGETGLGWVFFLAFGHPKAFNATSPRQKRKNPISLTTLPIYRAGADDLGHRVPAVATLRNKRVLVVGTGAVGAPVAVELARNGCGVLHLLEHDTVEPGNTVRWPLGAAAWGYHKLDALAGFLSREYPGTAVHRYPHCLGQAGPGNSGPGDDDVLDPILSDVDMVIDGSASHGVTTLLADRCREAGIPLISLFATPPVEGGAVVRYAGDGGCPNCLEYAWHNNDIAPPPGHGDEDGLTQPPGCGERTFIGAGYDLQELSLQAVRLAVETFSGKTAGDSLIQTLRFISDDGDRCPPDWRVDPLPKHPVCGCRS